MELQERMEKEAIIALSQIDSIDVLKKVCEAIVADAHDQIHHLAFKTDDESNVQRIMYKAKSDMAINLLSRLHI
ncbi:hypothetical protein ACIFOE_04640 [Paenibacillus sp. NRS-1783]|uniref:hypothetical protein n=1 Tax=Paenibacillus sp. NRS-1783 TaxID=3233907 RepID=UPI003D26C303